MQRSSVDLPLPLAATIPRRSAAPIARLRLENSGALKVTPRFRRLINAIFSFSGLPEQSVQLPGNVPLPLDAGGRSLFSSMRCAYAQLPEAKMLGATLPRADREELLGNPSLVSPANNLAGH